jgi:transcriptional regulator with XRE-family HTH domain
MNAPSPLQKLGGRIRERREAAGLSAARLAAAAGVDATALAAIEAGARDPDYRTLARLARALEVAVGELLSAMDEGERDDSEGDGSPG